MRCPFCRSKDLTVTNSRPTKKETQIWRRRLCLECDQSFTSYEHIDLSYLKVEKKSGKRERYNRSKLFAGIYRSGIEGKNLDKGDIASLTEEITQEVEREIILLKAKVVPSSSIIDIVLKTLHQKNAGTFLRFLAYREGNDEKKMLKFIEKYLRKT